MLKSSKISAVVITYNEEAWIEECIDSLQGVADEILIVDSYSTDATTLKAEAKGARVLSTDWEGYAKTKNKGNAAARYPMILSIDADERLSNELIASIQKVKEDGFPADNIYSFNRRNNYCGQWMRYAGWYPDTKVRIFHRDHTQWEGDVHEKLVHHSQKHKTHLNGDLLHYSILDKQDHIQRIHKYNKLVPTYSAPKAYVSALSQFFKMYILKAGFLDGKLGFQLCYLSALGKVWRQKKHLR